MSRPSILPLVRSSNDSIQNFQSQSKSNAWDISQNIKSESQRTFECSNWRACFIGLILALLISGIGLAVIVTIWQNSSTTATTTVAFTDIIYSQNFTSGVASTAQCPPWTSFVAQLTNRSYTLLRMYGTFDPVGISTNNSTIIENIALALRTSTAYGPVTSNSHSWVVGLCGDGYELSANGSTCQCTNPGYILRPCINHQDYGGVNSTTCAGPTQTMALIFRY
ncbi:unnamed protein product [Adineta steineri]|uniref:Uncharacterized protein n=1 Tax=Adineta steineri TaxID=433720 RepID=A0A814JZS0_9BILA|nr:unnamed protein product [Adineta steineri]CAF1044753.1 unnamed protein product [Adineta steineri]